MLLPTSSYHHPLLVYSAKHCAATIYCHHDADLQMIAAIHNHGGTTPTAHHDSKLLIDAIHCQSCCLHKMSFCHLTQNCHTQLAIAVIPQIYLLQHYNAVTQSLYRLFQALIAVFQLVFVGIYYLNRYFKKT